MLNRIILKRGVSREGENPFWISYSDLMTALMALFLLVMAVTLVSVTREVSSAEQRKIQREKDISELMSQIKEWSRQFPEVKVNESTFRIDLGDVVRFDSGSAVISPTGARLLRSYVPVLLQAQRSDLGRQWVRRIVVEGFTDTDGTYLFNLGLSLQRSQGVVCVLFAAPAADERPLTEQEKRQIRDLFLVGGYSFNSIKGSKEESRRVELKIDFWALDEKPGEAPAELNSKDFGRC